jgi:predicted nucleic acid-binding protein
MIEYALDTNTVAELMRGRPNLSLERRLARRWGACALPAPVVDELQYGVSRIDAPTRRVVYQEWLERLIGDIPVIPLDSMCAQWHGRERARLAQRGRPPPLYDGLIASIAVVNELTLVTHNTADFAGFTGIVLEDWL